jgi:uncharacterized metal-binding protein YceD (DUF177 family)
MGGMELPFSRPLRASHIKEDPQEYILRADPETRAELAMRFGLPEIAMLRGAFTLRHERAGVIAAELAMQAQLTQTCVVTLEPFPVRIEEHGALRFVPARNLPEAGGIELDAEALEGPDEIPYTNDQLLLGEALAEQLALALDPYPRKPGAELPAEFTGEAENPFSVLKFRRKE